MEPKVRLQRKELKVRSSQVRRLLTRPTVRGVAAGAVAVALCLGILAWALELWRADLRVPLVTSAPSSRWDTDELLAAVKGMLESGWWLRNPYLAAPFGMQLYDFPHPMNLDMFVMKLMSLFSSNYAVVTNLYFLLTFPLIVISSIFALRLFGVSYASALVASILFAFMPYHFMRGEGHLFLSAYYLIPLVAMVVLWVWFDRLRPSREPEEQGRPGPGRRFRCAILVAILVGCGEIYYAFFACFLLCVAAVAAALRIRSWKVAGPAMMLIAITVLSLAANGAPCIAYEWTHGWNSRGVVRFPQEAEVYGLKITEMLLPVTGHRLRYLAALKDRYLRLTQTPFLARMEPIYGRPGHPFANEADDASLGIVAGAGFLFLVGYLMWASKAGDEDLLRPLAVLTIAAVLLGTVGGFGSLFAFVATPVFRGFDRISIFIAFFCLFAVALLLDRLRRTLERFRFAEALWYTGLAVVLCVGIFDQTTPEFVPQYKHLADEYLGDAEFVTQIEVSVPPESMIFQLPYAPMPEQGPINKMRGWDLFKGYLHSEKLRWSYGVMTGRPEATWAKQFEGESLDQVVKTLAFAGFEGIYIDRYGYSDGASGIESSLESVLRESPIVSSNGRLSFFTLTEFVKSLKSEYSPAQWQQFHAEALRLPQHGV
jgi:hypothetical protein